MNPQLQCHDCLASELRSFIPGVRIGVIHAFISPWKEAVSVVKLLDLLTFIPFVLDFNLMVKLVFG